MAGGSGGDCLLADSAGVAGGVVLLRDYSASAGRLAAALPIARPGVSRHLRVLREAGLVDVRQEAQQRIYSLRPEALIEVDEWLAAYRQLWENRLDALHTESVWPVGLPRSTATRASAARSS